jgi:ergothioneine biosynthesis protein EgtB
MMNLKENYIQVRQRSVDICAPLKTEDYVVQPTADVSPPKWHLGHITWFFETFILLPHLPGYKVYDPNYNYVFNSYYETVGVRVIRTNRGNLSRPSVEDIYSYRSYVDEAMLRLLDQPLNEELMELIILGFNHEEQHQELLYSDIKYILGHNPLFPEYRSENIETREQETTGNSWVNIPGGLYQIGHQGEGFSFDNELARHQVYLQDFSIASAPVNNREWLEFIKAGGYSDFRFWHAEGWDWVKTNEIKAPLYWHKIGEEWQFYTLSGLQPLNHERAVSHVSFYEAAAFANWKGCRLPTEFEWETASAQFNWGTRWEWTESAYLPYPGFKKADGAIGEYNGKFMVNQKVLRGASIATPEGHSRSTYRNFFHAPLRWQFTGLRLVK